MTNTRVPVYWICLSKWNYDFHSLGKKKCGKHVQMEIKSDQNWHNNIISVRCLIVHQLWNIQNYLRPQPNFQVFFSTSTLSPSLSPKTLNALPIHKTKLWEIGRCVICMKSAKSPQSIGIFSTHISTFLSTSAIVVKVKKMLRTSKISFDTFSFHSFVFVVLYIFLLEFVSVVWLGLASCCYCCLCILSGNHRTKNWLVKRVNGLIFSLSRTLRACCLCVPIRLKSVRFPFNKR